jgi:hypothetical protein
MEDIESRGFWRRYMSHCRSMPVRDLKNARRANLVMLLWALTLLPALYLLKEELVPAGPLVWVAIAVPTLLSVAAVVTYIRFLRHADELLRKIQYEALGLGFGAGFVAAFALELLEEGGIGTYDAGDPMFAMILFYCIGILVGTRRYL